MESRVAVPPGQAQNIMLELFLCTQDQIMFLVLEQEPCWTLQTP